VAAEAGGEWASKKARPIRLAVDRPRICLNKLWFRVLTAGILRRTLRNDAIGAGSKHLSKGALFKQMLMFKTKLFS
jgi:hypothetical protein